MMVVLIAGAFLYDIWRFADFQETQLSISQIENMIVEDDDNTFNNATKSDQTWLKWQIRKERYSKTNKRLL